MSTLPFTYDLIRSKRRTLSVKITRTATVEVHAPRRMSVREIELFLADKSAWILSHLDAAQKRQEQSQSFVPGEKSELLLLGREYPLCRTDCKEAHFDGERFCVPQSIPQEELTAAVKEIYRTLAKEYLPQRTYDLARKFGESVNSVKINSARTRWGSCSTAGNINFSLFLMMAPSEAVDYCIIHELSHLKHMDHSAVFWSLVESRDDDYLQNRNELKQLSRRLLIENW